ncbi:MAG: undecaprenyl/decaprenyl-phosphate alpha-N-acetylglucosaminyl 1-phosphate transferase [Cyclobacteriaceae bacterium]|nr:undecaprenyl/decaprenyl-phosphate alpha-N-acetylglucosaminyl 1-phosphate transferase [Cyclobacteriaceae bacterium]
MITNFAAIATSFLISFLIVPVIIKYSLQANLVDTPGRRKIHKKETPSMGGIAIFIGCMVSAFVWMDFDSWYSIRYVLAALSVMFFVGLRDDTVPLKPYLKLLGQIVCAVIIVYADIRLVSFYGFLAIHDVPLVVSWGITIFTIIVVTNAYNLIDGLDGLAGTVSVLSLAVFGVWFFLIEDYIFSLLSFSMLGAILGFLYFNWEPSKIFMGDTGALVIGLFLSIMVIRFIHTNAYLPGFHPYRFKASIATGICIILVPLFDTLRIFILRVVQKKSPFKPDKSHIHHAIMRLGASHQLTTIILASLQATYILMAVALHNLGENYVLLIIFVLSVILSVTLDRMILKKIA